MKDRIPLHPGRVTLAPVEGQANTYDLVRADEPTEEGTPLNKASLLKDTTATLYWPDGDGPEDPTVDDVFTKIPDYFGVNGVFRVGDIVSSKRTDLGNNWLMANGEPISRESFPALSELYADEQYLFVDTVETPASYRLFHKVYGKNKFVLYNHSSVANIPSVCIIDAATGEKAIYTVPTGSQGQLSWLVGIDHNGSSWVAAFAYSTSITLLEISDDFSTIKNMYTYDSLWPLGTYYCDPNFMFDGVQYYLMAQYAGYIAIVLHTFNSSFGNQKSEKYAPSSSQSYSALMFRLGPRIALNVGENLNVIRQSEAAYDNIVSIPYPGSPAVFPLHYGIKITDTQYIIGGSNWEIDGDLFIYNSATNSASLKNFGSVLSYNSLGPIFFDVDTQTCVIGARYGTSSGYVYNKITIEYGKDPTVLSNYTILSNVNEFFEKTDLSNAVALDDEMVTWCVDGSKLINAIKLPSISLDSVYTYIKAKE